MSPPNLINENDVRQRIRDYAFNTLGQVASLTMSAVFATAALAFADILRNPQDQAGRMTSWIVGVLVACVALMRILHAGLFHFRPSAQQLPLILAWGFLATINFALLPQSIGGDDGWRHVFLVAIALNLIGLRLSMTEVDAANLNAMAPSLKPIVERRIAEFRIPAYGIIPSVLIGLGSYVAVWLAKSRPDPWLAIVVATNLFTIVMISVFALREMRSFDRFVTAFQPGRGADLKAPEASSSSPVTDATSEVAE